MVVNINMVSVKVKKRDINIDYDWVKANIEEEKWGSPFEINKMADELWIIDENGNKHKNFHELENSLPRNSATEFDLKYTYEFSNHFISVDPIGLLKIKSLSLVYDVFSENVREVIIDAGEIVDKILKDIITQEIKFIHKDGTIH